MVKIRLRRTGSKKKPSYRVVVADSRSPRDGRFIEIIGYYHPRTNPVVFEVHEDRALHWLSVGAQPTDIVEKLLKKRGTLDRFVRLKKGADLEELLAETEPPHAEDKQAGEVAAPAEAESDESGEKTEVEKAETA